MTVKNAPIDPAPVTPRRANAGTTAALRPAEPGVTLRLIEQEQAQLDLTAAWLRGELAGGWRKDITDPWVKARLLRQRGESEAKLSRLRADLAEALAAGLRLWARADFTRGDFARIDGRWFEVLRANPTTLAVRGRLDVRPAARMSDGRPADVRVRYGEVTGRLSAEAMARRSDSTTGL
ncbi:hypothetical protein [Embleya sp. NPDC001921]